MQSSRFQDTSLVAFSLAVSFIAMIPIAAVFIFWLISSGAVWNLAGWLPSLMSGAVMKVLGSSWGIDNSTACLIVSGLALTFIALALFAGRVDAFNEKLSQARMAAFEAGEANMRQFYRTIPMPHYTMDAERLLIEVSDRWLDLTGFSRDAVLGRTLHSFMTPNSADAYSVAINFAEAAGSDLKDFPCRMVVADNRVMDVLTSTKTARDYSGRTVSFLGGLTDVTARNRADEGFLHAEKIEIVGRITGGVAHDYNNVLSVIFGNLEMGTRALDQGNVEKVRRCLGNAFLGAERARKLTAGLLAFSRKQHLKPTMLDLGTLVGGMQQVLQQILGESIISSIIKADGLWMTMVDCNQMENALVNLALNSKEAMSIGGSLTFGIANRTLDAAYVESHIEVAPGDYVVVAVSDTGAGMLPETLRQAVEPFFTTKDAGGPGLGLSQVFGFVKQSGGHLEILSRLGKGTTVSIFLPRAA